jgi:hypothetical protein
MDEFFDQMDEFFNRHPAHCGSMLFEPVGLFL